MATRYWIEEDFDTGKPVHLYRANNATVEGFSAVRNKWVKSHRDVPELDGLGGWVPFVSIPASQADAWLLYFSGGEFPVFQRKEWDFDEEISGSFGAVRDEVHKPPLRKT